jgi:signal transduction histidine kinase
MELKRRNFLIYGLLFAVWLLVVGWQAEEHDRAKEMAKVGLRNRSRDVANWVSAIIRGSPRFRGGTVFKEQLEPMLDALVNRTNEVMRSSEVIWIALLDVNEKQLASAGQPTIDPEKEMDIVPEGGLWLRDSMTMEHMVAGMQRDTNQIPIVLPSFRELTNANPESMRGRGRGREPRPDEPGPGGPGPRPEGRGFEPGPPPDGTNAPPRDGRGPGDNRPSRRPFWARGMDEATYQSFLKRRELHGLVVAMSTDRVRSLALQDLWLRCVIVFFAGVSAVGVGVAWRNLAKTSDLQLRLVRTSELNSHLKEMNLAAAGLAHETRNPLNIIRGMAQMIGKQSSAPSEIREKSRAIVDESDKVTAQLNEFINYSRPREVRRSALALNAIIAEVARALSYDLQEKKILLEVKGERIAIEADEQLLRQVLFNLVINAIQAVGEGGEIQIFTQRRNASEGSIEVRDNGPGVPPERRAEIFKPYFTTQAKGTGLGLAIVQQNVLAHGWEIEVLANQPKGAIFRVTHLKLAKG